MVVSLSQGICEKIIFDAKYISCGYQMGEDRSTAVSSANTSRKNVGPSLCIFGWVQLYAEGGGPSFVA